MVSTPVGPVTEPPDQVRSALLPIAERGRRKVTFAALVWATGVPVPKVDGILTVRLGGRRLASARR